MYLYILSTWSLAFKVGYYFLMPIDDDDDDDHPKHCLKVETKMILSTCSC